MFKSKHSWLHALANLHLHPFDLDIHYYENDSLSSEKQIHYYHQSGCFEGAPITRVHKMAQTILWRIRLFLHNLLLKNQADNCFVRMVFESERASHKINFWGLFSDTSYVDLLMRSPRVEWKVERYLFYMVAFNHMQGLVVMSFRSKVWQIDVLVGNQEKQLHLFAAEAPHSCNLIVIQM